jgi:hypothetical protein
MCLFGAQVTTDSLADLKKVMAMRNSRLGALLGAGPPRELFDEKK